MVTLSTIIGSSAQKPATMMAPSVSSTVTHAGPLRRPSVGLPRTVHIILEVRDDGEPSLYSYRRVSVNVRPQ